MKTFSKYKMESIQEKFKLDGRTYDVINFEDTKIYVGEEGILTKNPINLPWDLIKDLQDKYKK